MKRSIVTNTDSAAGCLKAARIADEVIAIQYRLVTGPVPPISDPVAFFAKRLELGKAEARDPDEERHDLALSEGFHELAFKFNELEHIEIWFDPGPNSQIQLIHVLDWLRGRPQIVRKVSLIHANFRIGECQPEQIASLKPQPQEADEAQQKSDHERLVVSR